MHLSGEDNVDSVWSREEKTLKVTGAPLEAALLRLYSTSAALYVRNRTEQHGNVRMTPANIPLSEGAIKSGWGRRSQCLLVRDDGVRLVYMKAATVGDFKRVNG